MVYFAKVVENEWDEIDIEGKTSMISTSITFHFYVDKSGSKWLVQLILYTSFLFQEFKGNLYE
jgi:hypothetical protein